MDFEKGQLPQLTVPAGCWFASSVKNEDDYSFVGCTVAPGFDFDDFELATFQALAEEYPQHQEVIRSLTRS
jgi:predicted cupin superfamily sugar epimerase